MQTRVPTNAVLSRAQIVRQMHKDRTALIGVACTTLCEHIASVSALLDAPFISAGGCLGLTRPGPTSKPRNAGYPFLPVAPRDQALGKVILRVVQKFGQVFLLLPPYSCCD